MTPITRPESRYCEKGWTSMWAGRRGEPASGAAGPRRSPAPPSGLRKREVAGLELVREDDPRLGERHVRLRVLHEEHGGRPLLPVRALPAGEGDGAVPAR